MTDVMVPASNVACVWFAIPIGAAATTNAFLPSWLDAPAALPLSPLIMTDPTARPRRVANTVLCQ